MALGVVLPALYASPASMVLSAAALYRRHVHGRDDGGMQVSEAVRAAVPETLDGRDDSRVRRGPTRGAAHVPYVVTPGL